MTTDPDIEAIDLALDAELAGMKPQGERCDQGARPAPRCMRNFAPALSRMASRRKQPTPYGSRSSLRC